ncbi:MAG: hypothetical protein JSS27_19260 [Planctomycetes bacterium]|nr:hypothetical protein [Planctomycetota bacterium]
MSLFALGFAPLVCQADADEKPFAPTAAYRVETIQGFTVLINPEVSEHPDEAAAMRKELDAQLQAIVRVVPAKAVEALRRVRMWIEWEKKPKGAAEFHPSAQWLTNHGYNPEKAGCIELSNARNFVNWSRTAQPWMVLHEMAHAYHNLVLGRDDAAIEAAYQQAVERNIYDSVGYIKGGEKRAYALNNRFEYFAELSEAWFGKNDFFPYTREELKTHDPVGYELMEKSWGASAE